MTLELAVFDPLARFLEPFQHWPVVPDAVGVVQPAELYLLLRSPEMRDQELAGEKVPGSAQKGMVAERGGSGRMVKYIYVNRHDKDGHSNT